MQLRTIADPAHAQRTFFSGIGDGMRFTRHGLSGVPFQLRPMTVPNRQSGTLMQVQMRTTTTMLPNGTAANEWYLWINSQH